jgi:hypothetical protein
MTNRMKAMVFGTLCFLAGAVFVMLVGTSSLREAPSGRYQVASMAHAPGAFVLDTQTGHLWARALSYEGQSVDLGTLEHPTLKTFKPAE